MVWGSVHQKGGGGGGGGRPGRSFCVTSSHFGQGETGEIVLKCASGIRYA